MSTVLHEEGILASDVQWPKPDVYEAYKAMAQADSITVDPHKMGYVPYAAGMIVAKDDRITDLVSYFAPYTFAEGEAKTNPDLLGAFIMEGSKAGASAAAVWSAHEAIGLNCKGYGRLVGRSVEAAARFYQRLAAQGHIEAPNGRTYRVEPLVDPDFNLVAFVINPKGNTDLDVLNKLTLAVYDRCSYVDGPVYYDSFLTSHTQFTTKDYGEAPVAFLQRLGIDPQVYRDNPNGVWVLRACILTPFLHTGATFEEFFPRIVATIKNVLAEVDPA